jgi:hypothetical protein
MGIHFRQSRTQSDTKHTADMAGLWTAYPRHQVDLRRYLYSNLASDRIDVVCRQSRSNAPISRPKADILWPILLQRYPHCSCPLVLISNLDWAVYRLAGDAHCRSAVLLYASSYVTWTFQTHTFSNSIEAVLVSCTLVTILRFKHTRVRTLPYFSNCQANVSWTAFSLGILCSLGVFFRITFPAFVFPAMVSCIPELLRR